MPAPGAVLHTTESQLNSCNYAALFVSAEERALEAARARTRAALQTELGHFIQRGNLAKLLRTLGVEVKGGIKPGPQQLREALRRGKVMYHPDRVLKGEGGVAALERLARAEEISKILNGWELKAK